jgi:hypothetical protein
MTAVLLDRAQREAIRREIWIIASACEDVPLCLKPDRGGQTDRAYVVSMIGKLERWVAALDAIGWEESGDYEAQPVTVDAGLALWARGQAVEIEHALTEFHPKDEDLVALSGLRLMAEAVA